jgi:hypothetical protein
VEAKKYYIDPGAREIGTVENLEIITDKAGTGVPALVENLLK